MAIHDIAVPDRESLFSSPPFESVSAEARQTLVLRSRFVPFSQDEVVFSQGERVHVLAFVCSGHIKLSSTAAQGKECVLHIIRKNSFLDLGVLLYESGLPYSAIALSCGVLAVIDKEVFLEILAKNFAFCLRCMRFLTARQRLFINKLVGSQGRIAVSCRVASWLLHRSRMEGTDELHFDIGRELMARLLGVTRESLSRELSRLAEMGYIAVERRSIALLDKNALEKLTRL